MPLLACFKHAFIINSLLLAISHVRPPKKWLLVLLDTEYVKQGVVTLSISHMQPNLSHICTIKLTPKTT